MENKLQEFNSQTGEEIVRNFTVQETQHKQEIEAQISQEIEAQINKEITLAALLARLGITADEAKLLIG